MTIDIEKLRQLYSSKYQVKQLADTLQGKPSPVKPVVTKSDVDRKSITRYFIRGVSDGSEVIEIDSTQFDTFKDNPRFVTTVIKWKIVGPPYTSTTSYGAVDLGVEDYNKKQVENADINFRYLKNYIRDYLELWYSDGKGNRSFTRQTPILNPPFPSRVAFVPPRINVFNAPIPTPSVTPSRVPVPSVTPSRTPTPTPTPSITPSITPSPYIGNEGVWSGWAPLYPPIVTAGIAIITE